MATLTFMTQTIFDHGASARLGQVLTERGITKPLRDLEMLSCLGESAVLGATARKARRHPFSRQLFISAGHHRDVQFMAQWSPIQLQIPCVRHLCAQLAPGELPGRDKDPGGGVCRDRTRSREAVSH